MTDQVITSEQYQAMIKAPKKNKHRAVKTEYNGRVYDSIKEANFARDLDLLKRSGNILSWVPQVRFDLEGKAKHYVDFLIFYPDQTFRLVEIKGRDLAMGKLKRRQTEEKYQVKIEVV